MAKVWLSRHKSYQARGFNSKTLIYLGLTVKVIISKAMGKQTQSLRDWFKVCVGGEAPVFSSNASHRTSLTGRISS